jgi:HlyD family secretion protein
MTERQKKGLATLFGIGVLAVAALGVWIASGASARSDRSIDRINQADELDEARLSVVVAPLGERAGPANRIAYRGKLVPTKEVQLAFRRSGRIAQIVVEEGSTVASGERLATLDAADLRASLTAADAQIDEASALLRELIAGPRTETIRAAEAEVQRLQASVRLAEVSYARQQQLYEQSVGSGQAFDEARFGLDQQQAALAVAKERLAELQAGTRDEQIESQKARLAALQANRDLLQVQLADTEIVAPFAGQIAKRTLDEGAIVGPDTPVLRLIQIEPLEAHFGLSPSDALRLPPGTKVQIQCQQQVLPGMVSRCEPELDPLTHTQKVVVTLESPQGASRPPEPHAVVVTAGQTVSLLLPSVSSDGSGYWVPATALTRASRGMWSLYIAVPEATLISKVDETKFNHADPTESRYLIERREVQVMEVADGLCLVVGESVRAGELYVTTGLHRLAPGILVRLIECEDRQQKGSNQ